MNRFEWIRVWAWRARVLAVFATLVLVTVGGVLFIRYGVWMWAGVSG